MSDFQEGNYDNCTLKEATFGEGDFGPQWVLTFDVSGVNRTVYLSCGTDQPDKNGKTGLEKTVATLAKMGWNQDFDNPQFTEPVQNLYMKVNANGKDRWYISDGAYKVAPASQDQRQNFKTAFRAANGAPKPAATRPTPAPTKAPARPGAAPARPGSSTHASTGTVPLITAKDLDEAWAAIQKTKPSVTSESFYGAIETYSAEQKIAEAAFTPTHWSAIVEICTLPDAPFA